MAGRPSWPTSSPTSASRRASPASTTCCTAATSAAAPCSSRARRAPPSRRWPGCSPPPPARAGERTLYVSFDAGAAQIVRDLRSVGIRLAPHVASGLLDIYSTRTHGPTVEDQFAELRMQVVAHAPRCLVIDPLSALSTTRTHVASVDAAQQFLDFLKGERITVVHTALTDRRDPDEAVESGMSSMSDAWIHLSYVAQEGERNRALTIMKSRGSGHSNQVLELTLSDRGVALSDGFVAEGKVLMGAARAEWERRERAAATRRQVASDARRPQLELAQAEAHARLRLIEAEIAAHGAEVALLVAAAVPTSPTTATRGAKSAAKSAGRRAR
ncbi:MAG: ATPase domain-containing protein [Myxococcota bacterium]